MKSIETDCPKKCRDIATGGVQKCVAMALEDMVYGEPGGSVKMRVELNDLNGLLQP